MKNLKKLINLIGVSVLVACTPKPVDLKSEQDQVIAKVAVSAEAKKYYAYAAVLREKYLANHPADLVTMQVLAQDLARANNWQKSLFYLNKLSKKKPHDAKLKLALAHAYLHVEAWHKAFKIYQELLAESPSVEAYNGMGVILNAAKQHRAAKQCFAYALALDPNNSTTQNNQALTLALLGEQKPAIEILEALAVIEPESPYKKNLILVRKNHNLWQHFFKHKLSLNYSCNKNKGA